MPAHERRLAAEAADVREQRGAVGRMALDQRELGRAQRSGLAQDLAGHLQLADIVQQGGHRQAAQAAPRRPISWPTLTASRATRRVCSRVERP